jgi:hypothetical protein
MQVDCGLDAKFQRPREQQSQACEFYPTQFAFWIAKNGKLDLNLSIMPEKIKMDKSSIEDFYCGMM